MRVYPNQLQRGSQQYLNQNFLSDRVEQQTLPNKERKNEYPTSSPGYATSTFSFIPRLAFIFLA